MTNGDWLLNELNQIAGSVAVGMLVYEMTGQGAASFLAFTASWSLVTAIVTAIREAGPRTVESSAGDASDE